MKREKTYFEMQYTLVQHSRNALFEYCHNLSQLQLLKENNNFGRGGSIRNLLVHIANTYEFWIVKNALHRDIEFTAYNSKSSMDDIEELFRGIDKHMARFLLTPERSMFEPMDIEINGETKKYCPFQLFTHVITHEFHHKGQVLSLSRHLGYIPVDTDIIR